MVIAHAVLLKTRIPNALAESLESRQNRVSAIVACTKRENRGNEIEGMNMNKYLLITKSKHGHGVTSTLILADSATFALSQAFEYYQGPYLKPDEFHILCENIDTDRALKLFEQFSQESICYFGAVKDDAIVDNLQIIGV